MPYNPFAGWRITGTWEDHASYSAGGEDYPLPYGTPLPMPAAGVLYTEGRPRSGEEFQCGTVGTAGRRQILMLDQPLGDVVAVVFQHLSVFGGRGRHYEEGENGGRSGASAVVNGVLRDYGGDVHLHVHCLTASGKRRKFTDYFGSTATAGGGAIPIPKPAPKEEDMINIITSAHGIFNVAPGSIISVDNQFLAEVENGHWGPNKVTPISDDTGDGRNIKEALFHTTGFRYEDEAKKVPAGTSPIPPAGYAWYASTGVSSVNVEAPEIDYDQLAKALATRLPAAVTIDHDKLAEIVANKLATRLAS